MHPTQTWSWTKLNHNRPGWHGHLFIAPTPCHPTPTCYGKMCPSCRREIHHWTNTTWYSNLALSHKLANNEFKLIWMSDVTTVISARCQLAIWLYLIFDLKANLYLHPMKSSLNNGVIGGSLRIWNTKKKFLYISTVWIFHWYQC